MHYVDIGPLVHVSSAITPDTLAALDRRADLDNITRAAVIRRALEELVEVDG
jgi:hypothetical protein